MIKFMACLALGLVIGLTLGLFVADNPKCKVAAVVLAVCSVLGVVGLWLWLVWYSING